MRGSALQPGSGAKDAAILRLLEERSGFRASESVKKAESDAGSLGGASGMGIASASGCANAGNDGGFEAAVRGKRVTPELQQAGLAQSELTVGIDTGATLALEDFGPRRGIVRFGGFGGADEDGEDV
jgi:hypothetical protein